jgi:N-acetylneuraminic acid mutarotase
MQKEPLDFHKPFLVSLAVITLVVLWFSVSSNTQKNINQNSAAVATGIGNPGQIVAQKVFLLGGAQTSVPSGYSNDVWSTQNMSAWTQLLPNAQSSSRWSQRASYGFASSIYFNNKIWVFAGQDISSNFLNDIWSSPDGVTWRLETSNPGWSAGLVLPLVFNNKLWVFGGLNAGGTGQGDVWSSVDGVTWTRAVSGAPWGARSMTNPVVFNNKIFIAGGWGQPGVSMNDVWSSPDGINWTQVTAHAPWASRNGHSTIVFNNKLYVLGGYDSNNYMNDVWSSVDGITWTQVTAHAPWALRYAQTSLVFNNTLYILGGNNGPLLNDIWSSVDGITWTQVTAHAPWAPRYYSQTVVVTPPVLPDLTVSSLIFDANSLKQSNSPRGVVYTFTVRNVGSAPVTLPAGFKFKLQQIAPVNRTIGEVSGAGTVLAPGNGTVFYSRIAQYSSPLFSTLGPVQVSLVADSTNLVTESDETNNTTAGSFTIIP